MLIESADAPFIKIKSERFHTNRETLVPLIDQIQNRQWMVEVGSLAGFSTRLFSNYFDRVVSIDPYSFGYDSEDMNSSQNRLAIAKDLFTLRFMDDPNVEQINESSKIAAERFEDQSIPFVYIDAGHNYENVKCDIDSWRSKVISGHYLAGDDYNWPGVKSAVNEAFPDHQVINNRWFVKVND